MGWTRNGTVRGDHRGCQSPASRELHVDLGRGIAEGSEEQDWCDGKAALGRGSSWYKGLGQKF